MQAAIEQFTRFSRTSIKTGELTMRYARVFAFCHATFCTFGALFGGLGTVTFITGMIFFLENGELVVIEHL